MEKDQLKPIILHDGQEVNHGDCVDLPIDLIVPNMYNPNVLSEDDFQMLMDNVDKIGFVDPIVVTTNPDDPSTYITVDGHHRIEQQRITGNTEIPAIVVSPEIFDEKTIMLQTVRLNKIRGSLNTEKFNALVNHLMQDHEMPFEDLAGELGFADESEFDAMVARGKQQLPKEAHKEYDKAVKNAGNDINKLARIIERLYLKYSTTIPANFMVLEFNNKRHLWVMMKPETMAPMTDLFRGCMSEGYTIDSLIEAVLFSLPVSEIIAMYRDRLRRIEEEEGAQQTLDDLLEP